MRDMKKYTGILLLLLLSMATGVRARLPVTCTWGGKSGYAFWGGAANIFVNDTLPSIDVKAAMPAPSSEFVISSRFRSLNDRISGHGTSSPRWGMRLTSIHGDTLEVLHGMEKVESVMDDEQMSMLSIRLVTKNNEVKSTKIPFPQKALALYKKEKLMRISAAHAGVSVEVGTEKFTSIWHEPGLKFPADTVALILNKGASVEIISGSIACHRDEFNGMETVDVAALKENMRCSADLMEGEWEYLDRNTDEQSLRLGGRYRLLSVADGKGGYNLYYLSGAELYPMLWQNGMLKARLTKGVAGRYRLSWRDAEGRWIDNDMGAALETYDVMTLLFPHQQSTIRFKRCGY